MEAKEENLITVKAERSYINCFTLGLDQSFRRLGLLLKYAWPGLLFAILLPIPGLFFLYGQKDAILRKWVELGYVPQVKARALKEDILKRTPRSIVYFLIALVLLLLLLACWPVAFLLKWPLWIAAIADLVLLFLAVPLEPVVSEIAFSDKPVAQCFKAYAAGCRNYGNVFAFCLLATLFIGFCAIVGSIPLIAVGIVSLKAYEATLMGDALDLPTLFPLIAYIAYFFAAFVYLMAAIMLSFPHCLFWGSMMHEEGLPFDSSEGDEK